LFQHLLGDGSKLGCRFEYKIQPEPNGLAQAFVIGKSFIGNDKVALVLGDNIFFGSGMGKQLVSSTDPDGGYIFAYRVNDPERYGVVEFGEDEKVISIEEKPETPKSNYAVPGLYFYDNQVVDIAENIQPSSRGEYEITDINREYLSLGKLKVKTLPRGVAWLDTGTFRSLIQASHFVQTIEERQGVGVGCIEALAYSNGFITAKQLKELAIPLIKSGYGNYLMGLID
jgi:glucose-1-phosphate thymidylyltransferase